MSSDFRTKNVSESPRMCGGSVTCDEIWRRVSSFSRHITCGTPQGLYRGLHCCTSATCRLVGRQLVIIYRNRSLFSWKMNGTTPTKNRWTEVRYPNIQTAWIPWYSGCEPTLELFRGPLRCSSFSNIFFPRTISRCKCNRAVI